MTVKQVVFTQSASVELLRNTVYFLSTFQEQDIGKDYGTAKNQIICVIHRCGNLATEEYVKGV